MIQKDHYLEIASKYGHCASWAVWAEPGSKPKSNVGDISIFDEDKNPKILDQLNPNVIMVGLNISRRIENRFGNFHDSRPQGQDYKIRYGFRDTKCYGAYMTDIIKDFEQVVSGNVISFLNRNKDFERQNILLFRQELLDLKSDNIVIIAFGNHVFNILDKHFKSEYQIVKVPHYSKHISKEDYRNEIGELMSNVI